MELGFFFDRHFDLGGDVAEDPDGHREFADSFERLTELCLALLDLEALSGESFGNVGGRDRAKHLVVLTGFARELQRNAVEQLGLFLRRLDFRGGLLGQRGANALDGLQVARGGFDGEFFGQKKIPRVAGLDGDDVAAVAELFNIFLKNNLHESSLGSFSLRPWALLRLQLAQLQRVQLQPARPAQRARVHLAQRRAALACPPRCLRTAAARCCARA